VEIRARYFTVGELFGALRGVTKPLQQNDAVDLIFEDLNDCPGLFTDEAKVAQILRNLISNALKYSERGEVRVSATFDGETRQCSLDVAAPGSALHLRTTIWCSRNSPRSPTVCNTVPRAPASDCRCLAGWPNFFGGTLSLRSTPGAGSAFTLCIPISLPQASATAPAVVSQPGQPRGVLVIDDEETSRYVLRQMLAGYGPLRVQEAETGAEGLRLAQAWRPDVVLLDLRLPDIDGFDVMDRLRADPATADIPVIVCTSSVLTPQQRGRLTHARTILSKAALTREVMQRALGDIWLTDLPIEMPEPSK
jgi:CheY-like chemotaxis protein